MFNEYDIRSRIHLKTRVKAPYAIISTFSFKRKETKEIHRHQRIRQKIGHIFHTVSSVRKCLQEIKKEKN